MKNIAIISEYNLLHGGHLRQIEHIRGLYGEECRIISIMSGSFTQRGIPALLPKHTRARLVVDSGVDLVLELPYPWSSSAAQLFAVAGVHIAGRIGADAICFGSESGELELLRATADKLASPELAAALDAERRANPHSDESYIRMRERVFRALCGSELPSSANDILGVEYLRAINELDLTLEPIVIKRVGEESATRSRKYALSGDIDSLRGIVPAPVVDEFERGGIDHAPYEALVLGFMRICDPRDIASYADMSLGLACRMSSCAKESRTLEEYYTAASTKKYTTAQIRRCTLYAMTRVTSDILRALPPYTRLLASNERGREFLSEGRKGRAFPIISKPSHLRTLPDEAKKAYELSERAEDIYRLMCDGDTNAPYIKVKG